MKKFVFDFDAFAKSALDEIGDVLVEGAKDNMDDVSIGRIYLINGKTHIASKEGDTANNLSGALKNSIRFETQGNILEFGAGDEKINYAKYLENPNILNRPNYTKTILANEKKIDKVIKEELFKNIRFK